MLPAIVGKFNAFGRNTDKHRHEKEDDFTSDHSVEITNAGDGGAGAELADSSRTHTCQSIALSCVPTIRIWKGF